jgi:hypothetical protein
MTPEATPLGEVINVREARLVVIHDVWTGYSAVSPIAAIYELHRGPRGTLNGEGTVSTGGVKPKRTPVGMRAATATAFLEAIATCRVSPGDYQPFQDHTDDYSHIEVALHVGPAGWEKGGIVVLYTESQGEFYAPWGAFIGGRSYVVEGEGVGRALRALDRPLKRAALRRLADG